MHYSPVLPLRSFSEVNYTTGVSFRTLSTSSMKGEKKNKERNNKQQVAIFKPSNSQRIP